jgi:glyoxylase-like metal-dependent hydrolase (beta-lactamase superfamily II)
LARSDPLARQMLNFVYLVGDGETGEAVAVDPAHAPGDILDLLDADGMRLTGVLATHYHPDHVGGEMFGFTVAGLPDLLERSDVPPRPAGRGPLRHGRDRRDRITPSSPIPGGMDGPLRPLSRGSPGRGYGPELTLAYPPPR